MTDPRDGPGHCSQEEPEVSWVYIYREVKYSNFASTFDTAFDVYLEVDSGMSTHTHMHTYVHIHQDIANLRAVPLKFVHALAVLVRTQVTGPHPLNFVGLGRATEFISSQVPGELLVPKPH